MGGDEQERGGLTHPSFSTQLTGVVAVGGVRGRRTKGVPNTKGKAP